MRLSTVLIFVPLALLGVIVAVANRHGVTFSLDPFAAGEPAIAFTLPLFIVVLGAVAFGFGVGALAVWAAQGRWRRAARSWRRKADDLEREADAARTRSLSLPD